MNKCPVCELEGQAAVSDPDRSDIIIVECIRCGQFRVSEYLDLKEKSAELSAWLRERQLLGIEIPILTRDFLENLKSSLPEYQVSDKRRRLLKAIDLLTEYPGMPVSLDPVKDAPLAWTRNENEFEFYIKSLIELDLVRTPSNLAHDQPRYTVFITPSGWTYLEQHQLDLSAKTQAFVAMSFDNSLLPVYNEAIVPGIKEAGFIPYRVDATPHGDLIDAKIEAEIKNSRFLVADVTQQKAGVYYEAGLAKGLGIPVIWSVRSDDLDNVHFDTRQYYHIVWETSDELKDNLRHAILATIGHSVRSATA